MPSDLSEPLLFARQPSHFPGPPRPVIGQPHNLLATRVQFEAEIVHAAWCIDVTMHLSVTMHVDAFMRVDVLTFAFPESVH